MSDAGFRVHTDAEIGSKADHPGAGAGAHIFQRHPAKSSIINLKSEIINALEADDQECR